MNSYCSAYRLGGNEHLPASGGGKFVQKRKKIFCREWSLSLCRFERRTLLVGGRFTIYVMFLA